jgi:hypothetical protein
LITDTAEDPAEAVVVVVDPGVELEAALEREADSEVDELRLPS